MLKSVHQLKRIGGEGAWGRLAYGVRFETFNYGGQQPMSADDVATRATR
ncbi:hypothetical protein ATJ93_1488 [Halopiger aswanensis]|uniref:Uncharacterized protein n=1 Tax=Halopiger aswanensis TaxID=148449 RepID=A0A3R7GV46_9EURY|nr:hypothetical protein ATJ93_1488 [Halopiger aswanensis]